VLLGAHVVTGSDGIITGGGAAGDGAVCPKAVADAVMKKAATMLKRLTKLTSAIPPAENHRKDDAARAERQSKPRDQ
jgi:hypothetical protein